MPTKEELRDRLRELDAEQPPEDAKKEELEKAVAKAEGSSDKPKGASWGTGEDGDSLEEDLSPSGQEALEDMPEGSKDVAALELDARGAMHLQNPADRPMTGAVSEEQAKEFDKVNESVPDDYVGEVPEAGLPEDTGEPVGQPKRNLSENDERDPEDVREVYQEDVIDYPPNLATRQEQATGEKVDPHATVEQSPGGAFHNEPLGSASAPGARSRLWEQKAVFYTDGLSGAADHNQERAYEIPEKLQSNDPATRASGDESLSEAAQEQRSDAEKREGDRVKDGSRVEDDN